jgi:hypothetical protein
MAADILTVPSPPTSPSGPNGKADGSRTLASGLMGQALGAVKGIADQQKSAVAGRGAEMAEAVHKVADMLDREIPVAAPYVRQAASRIDNAASILRGRSLDELAGQLNDFTRKQPFLVTGAMLAVGFMVARFVRAASETGKPGPGAPQA